MSRILILALATLTLTGCPESVWEANSRMSHRLACYRTLVALDSAVTIVRADSVCNSLEREP